MRPRISVCLALVCLLALGDTATSAPIDAKVGDTRATYNRKGTPLRGQASALAAPIATLPYGTRVRVLEKSKGWFRVQAGAHTGWLRSFHTVELAAISGNAQPAHLTARGSAGVSGREVSAAGRQLDANTERGYRSSRADLQRAYRLVDAMEAATARLDPGESLMFIDGGDIGRAGRAYGRPGRIPGGPEAPRGGSGRKARSGVGGLLGRLGGEAARRLGAGDRGGRIAESLITGATEYVNQVKRKFSPRQEYFLGRAVAAEAIAKYGVDPDNNRRRYVRLVGDAIVRCTARLPGNFGGYHFEVLNSDVINGVSGPGGFVLVTRGAVNACRSESELAAVLSHELAHISMKHGEKMLRSGREFPTMVNSLAGVAGAAAGQGQWSQGLVRFFGQVARNVSNTAINHGYGRTMEFQADGEGNNIVWDVYYNWGAMQSFLRHMRPESHAFVGSATHPSPAARVQALDRVVAPWKPYQLRAAAQDARNSRFQSGTGVAPPK